MQDERERAAIWSIPIGWRLLYLLLFSTQFIALSAFVAWYEIAVNTADTWPQTIIAIGNGISPWVIVIVADSAIITEATMLVSQYLIEKYHNKRRREGVEEGIKIGEERGIKVGEERGIKVGEERGVKVGREERQQQWEEWNRRRMEAEAANQPFTEPPPGQN